MASVATDPVLQTSLLEFIDGKVASDFIYLDFPYEILLRENLLCWY